MLNDLVEKKTYVNLGQGSEVIFKVAKISSMSDKEIVDNVEEAYS